MEYDINPIKFNTEDSEKIMGLWPKDFKFECDSAHALNRKWIQSGDLTFVAKEQESGKIIGTIMAFWDGWMAKLYHLYVDPEYRGKGVGSNLLDEIEHKLKDKGANRILLDVLLDDDNSREFFIQNGYSERGVCITLEKVMNG